MLNKTPTGERPSGHARLLFDLRFDLRFDCVCQLCLRLILVCSDAGLYRGMIS